MRVERIGNATLYLGDCMAVLPTLAPVDALVTDPPYGIAGIWQGGRSGGWRNRDDQSVRSEWDGETHPAVYVALEKATDAIIWGGNYYALPPRRGWLVWDKIVRNFSTGHCELAWTTLDQPVRAFNYAHGQLANEGKFHPTQKPVPLMEWCLSFVPKARVVLDPFMGAGSTGVACASLGKEFIGVEMRHEFFEIACKRIAAAQAQGRLFA